MLKIIILIACTLVGGVIGGMGMGGGTLTIPLLTIFCGLTQHEAQAINLVAFIPMAAITLIIHTKNKLVEYKKVLPIALPALATSVACSFFALKVKGKNACFLIRRFSRSAVDLSAYDRNNNRSEKEKSGKAKLRGTSGQK